jgi:hypothetical protein
MASQTISIDQAPAADPATRKSTGPRTPEGKARSAQNARKHSFSAQTLQVLPNEQAEFDTYQNELLDEIKPASGLQADLFRQLLHAGWTLRRLERYELEILEQGNPFDSPEAQAKLDRLERYRAAHRRAYSRTLAEIRKLQTDALLWFVTHQAVQDASTRLFPLANPSARNFNKRILELSDELRWADASRSAAARAEAVEACSGKTNSEAAAAAAYAACCAATGATAASRGGK